MTPTFAPFLASRRWWELRGSLLLAGHDAGEAAALASVMETQRGLKGRDWLRCLLPRDASGCEETQTFSLPLCGGAHAAKSQNPQLWRVSDHGRWPHLLLGMLDAIYGRTPFYRHLMPRLEPLISRYASSAPALCNGLDTAVCEFLGLHNTLEALQHSTPLLAERKNELLQNIGTSRDVSILDTAFRFGPDTLFLLSPQPDNSISE